MVESSLSIRLESVPKKVRKKIAASDEINLAGIARSFRPPVTKGLVSRVLHGKATSAKVQAALEARLSEILVHGNKFGWWPNKERA